MLVEKLTLGVLNNTDRTHNGFQTPPSQIDVVYGLALKKLGAFVKLNANKLAPFHSSTDQKAAATKGVVQNQIPRIGVSLDQITGQRNRLLRGMPNLSLALRCLKVNDIGGVTLTRALNPPRRKVTIASRELGLPNTLIIRLTLRHLRVIRGVLRIKDYNVLMLTQRLLFGIKEISGLGLLPNQLILEPSFIRKNKLSSKDTLCRKNYNTIRLQNPPILLPKQREIYNTIPFVLRRAVRQIAQNQIDRPSGETVQYGQAIPLEQSIR